jgi:prepilin-type N-terminal cleavage/methylation domain-containing protein
MKRAFTLIELLVVIAIIAILAAILFPVFAQAKNAAKKTQSLSNSKNQITGVIMYTGDTDDVLPFSEAGCDNDESQVQWYATVHPYIKNGKTETNSRGELRAYGNDGIFRDPSHPDPKQGQHYGLNRELFPANYCPASAADITPSISASAVEAPADKIAVGIKNKNGPFWSYPYFSGDEWMWTARFKRDGSGNVISDGSEIQSGLAPRDWGYVMNKDCSGDSQSMEECGAALSYRYNGQTIVSYLDGHAASAGKGRLQWFKNVAHNSGYRWWKESWYPYNGY